MIARRLGIAIIIIAGLLGSVVIGYYSLVDWNALQAACLNYVNVVRTTINPTSIVIAYQVQSIHRLNLFADGVWTLLSAILAAIGICFAKPEKLKHDLKWRPDWMPLKERKPTALRRLFLVGEALRCLLATRRQPG